MIKTHHVLALSGAALAALLCAPTAARAGSLDACGDIFIEAGAECELIPPSANCTVMCTPITVQAACAAQLTATCSGECSASATVECTGECTGSCEGECEAEPGSFDCQTSCQATCEGNCSGSCSAADNQAECMSSCEATCSGSCDTECEGTPPSATCEAKCEASCDGSCDAEANIECQVGCQADGYVDCTAEVTGGCEAACETEEGALFCDGSYVDYGNNLDECVQALKDLFNIEVEGYASAECEGNMCEAEAGGSATCGVGGTTGGAAAGWILIGLAFAMRRRRAR